MALIKFLNRSISSIVTVAAFSWFLSGCSYTITEFPPDSKMQDLKLNPLPLSAALVMPPSLSNAVYEGLTWCPLPPWSLHKIKITYGKEFERLSKQAFSQAFVTVDFADEKTNVLGRYDTLIEITPIIDSSSRHCLYQAGTILLTVGLYADFRSDVINIALQAKVSNTDGRVLFEHTYGGFVDTDSREEAIMAKDVSKILQGSLNSITTRILSDSRLLQYAKSLPGTPEERMKSRQTTVVKAEPVPSIPLSADEKLPPPRKDAHALVIGIDYKGRDGIPGLQYASQDAKKVYAALTDPRYGGIPKENATLLLNEKATRIEIMKALRRIKGMDGYVYLYYTGHGAPKTKGDKLEDGLLVPSDVDNSDAESLEESSIRMSYIQDMLDTSPAKGVLVALDACFSGGGEKSITAKGGKPLTLMPVSSELIKPKGTGKVILTSSATNQQSWEDDTELHGGIFSHYLLEGMKGKAGKDVWVNANELAEYIKVNVPKAAKNLKGADQNPQVIGQADFAVSRNWERSKVLDIEMAGAKIKAIFEKGVITTEQFNRAMDELKTPNRSKTLESFLEGKIDEKKFGTVY